MSKSQQKNKESNSTYKKDDEILVNIEDISVNGEGIGHVDGYTIFVKDTVPGDLVKVKIIKAKKTYGYGRLMEIEKESEDRVNPPCAVARQCGGCQIQHLSYEKQLLFKQNHVKNCLERIGGIEDAEKYMEPIIGMENPYFYRNKAQFPVAEGKDGSVNVGFYAGRSHSIIPADNCYIQAKENNEIIKLVKEWMTENRVKAYDEKSQSGVVRHIMTRVGFVTKEVMVCIVINSTSLNDNLSKTLVDKLCKVKNIASIMLNFNTDNTNVILGQKVKVLYGNGYLSDYIGDIQYHISPLSFYQVNPVQTKKLYDTVLEYAFDDDNKDKVVWDLYCGIGTISLFLAKKAKMVYGVEIVPEAIDDARNNAKINDIYNVQFFCGAAEEVVPSKYEMSGGAISADIVVVDPPRKGCDEKLLSTIALMKPERIVYVSCDPSSLARDLKWLLANGYEIKKVRTCDQFCHTIHVETVVLMSRVEEK